MNVTGNTSRSALCTPFSSQFAAMEPGERHREHIAADSASSAGVLEPQWGPVNVTGNTPERGRPVHRTEAAAMEPGERHREHDTQQPATLSVTCRPQWSPVNVTGNTPRRRRPNPPGDRMPQWSPVNVTGNTSNCTVRSREVLSPQWSPVNVTWEHPSRHPYSPVGAKGRNGAR